MAPGDYYDYSLILLFIIIILLIIIAVSTSKQIGKSKDIEDALYRLIEIEKKSQKVTDE